MRETGVVGDWAGKQVQTKVRLNSGRLFLRSPKCVDQFTAFDRNARQLKGEGSRDDRCVATLVALMFCADDSDVKLERPQGRRAITKRMNPQISQIDADYGKNSQSENA